MPPPSMWILLNDSSSFLLLVMKEYIWRLDLVRKEHFMTWKFHFSIPLNCLVTNFWRDEIRRNEPRSSFLASLWPGPRQREREWGIPHDLRGITHIHTQQGILPQHARQQYCVFSKSLSLSNYLATTYYGRKQWPRPKSPVHIYKDNMHMCINTVNRPLRVSSLLLWLPAFNRIPPQLYIYIHTYYCHHQCSYPNYSSPQQQLLSSKNSHCIIP